MYHPADYSPTTEFDPNYYRTVFEQKYLKEVEWPAFSKQQEYEMEYEDNDMATSPVSTLEDCVEVFSEGASSSSDPHMIVVKREAHQMEASMDGAGDSCADPGYPAEIASRNTDSVVDATTTTADEQTAVDDDEEDANEQATVALQEALSTIALEARRAMAHATLPRMADLMDPINSGMDTDTVFTDSAAAYAHLASGKEIPVDATLPRNNDQKRAIVKALFNAMKSVEWAEDNEGMKKPFINNKWKDERIEQACWKILDACTARHIAGPLRASIGVQHKSTGEIQTFGKRMELILQCLLTQKTMCKHLLDPMYLHSFIDDPEFCRKRVNSNKSLNKRKGAVMEAGRNALRSANESAAVDEASGDAAAGSAPQEATDEVTEEADQRSNGKATRKTPRKIPRKATEKAIREAVHGAAHKVIAKTAALEALAAARVSASAGPGVSAAVKAQHSPAPGPRAIGQMQHAVMNGSPSRGSAQPRATDSVGQNSSMHANHTSPLIHRAPGAPISGLPDPFTASPGTPLTRGLRDLHLREASITNGHQSGGDHRVLVPPEYQLIGSSLGYMPNEHYQALGYPSTHASYPSSGYVPYQNANMAMAPHYVGQHGQDLAILNANFGPDYLGSSPPNHNMSPPFNPARAAMAQFPPTPCKRRKLSESEMESEEYLPAAELKRPR